MRRLVCAFAVCKPPKKVFVASRRISFFIKYHLTAKCEPGTFSKDGYKNANTGKCTKCKTGEYQGGSGQRECLTCPGMKKSLEPGSSECSFGK